MRRSERIFLWVMAIAVALLLLRAALPEVVESYVNRKLATMGDYRGRVDEVDLHLWRGAYTLHGLTIEKDDGKVPVPLLSAPTVELAVSWRGLIAGGIVGTVEFDRADLNFVDAESDARQQGGTGVNWRQKLEELLPIQLDEVVLRDCTIHFRNVGSDPPVDLKATQVNAVVKNLTNVEDRPGGRVASFEATARVLDQAGLEAAGEFDPVGRPDTFALKLRVLDVDLKRANSFVRAYSGLDVASGRGDFVMEVSADKGQLRGYAKPLLRDLQVFSWKRDVDEKGLQPLRLAWQSITAFAVEVFTNRKNDQFGTRVELSGSLDQQNVDVLGALLGIVRNAFVEDYKPDFESLQKSARPSPEVKSK